jgi:pimeloyl-ACP methyl ester carboxylesterase
VIRVDNSVGIALPINSGPAICCVIVPEWSCSELLQVRDDLCPQAISLHSLSWHWVRQGFARSFADRFMQTRWGEPGVMVGPVCKGPRIAVPSFLGASVAGFRGYDLLARGLSRTRNLTVSTRMFAYDWRQEVETVAIALCTYLRRLSSSLDASVRIVLIGHGLGGVIAGLARKWCGSVVHSVVTVATPWRGTIEGGEQLVNGFRFGPGRKARHQVLLSYPSSGQRVATFHASVGLTGVLADHPLLKGSVKLPMVESALTSNDLMVVGVRLLPRTPTSSRVRESRVTSSRRSSGDGVIGVSSSDPRKFSDTAATVCVLSCRNDKLITNAATLMVIRQHLESPLRSA